MSSVTNRQSGLVILFINSISCRLLLVYCHLRRERVLSCDDIEKYIYGFWLPLWYLRYTDSDYPFGIFKLFILWCQNNEKSFMIQRGVISSPNSKNRQYIGKNKDWHSLSISRCRSRYQSDLAVYVVSFIPSSIG